MSDIFKSKKGMRVKIFLTNGYKYEGVIQESNDRAVTIFDDRDKEPISLLYDKIVNYRLKESKTQKGGKN